MVVVTIGLYVVASGHLRIFKTSASGREHAVGFIVDVVFGRDATLDGRRLYEWHWRALLPFSARLRSPFLIFFRVVSGHRSEAQAQGGKLDEWILVVITGSIGWLAALVMNFVSATFLAWRAHSPVLPHGFHQRLLVLET
jgi:hypothetical protein